MNTKRLAFIGLRLIGVYLMAQGITMLPELATATATFGQTQGAGNFYWTMLAGTFIWLVIGAVIWSTAPWLSTWVAPPDTAEPLSVSSGDLVQGAIGVVGIAIAVLALPAILGFIYTLISGPLQDNVNRSESLYFLGYRLVLVVLGVLMVIFARRLRSWIFRVRELVAE